MEGDSEHVTQRDSKRRRVAEDDPVTECPDLRAIIREELKTMMNTMQTQQNSRLDLIEKRINEIKSQNDTIHKKNLDIEHSIEFATAKLDELQLTITRLEAERKEMTLQITNIG